MILIKKVDLMKKIERTNLIELKLQHEQHEKHNIQAYDMVMIEIFKQNCILLQNTFTHEL